MVSFIYWINNLYIEIMARRVCNKCGIEKNLKSFSPASYTKDRVRHICKVCVKKTNRAYYKSVIKRKELQQNNIMNVTVNINAFSDSEVLKREIRWKSYGITDLQSATDLWKVSTHCAICNKQFTRSREKCLDHDHSSQKVRGILCRMCNTALGHFGDNKEGILRVLKYLEK